jgi:hypothetical protein
MKRLAYCLLMIVSLSIMVAEVLSSECGAQATAAPGQSGQQPQPQLNVNWLYGAYVPKDVPLVSLTNRQRLKLYVRQSFTTPGIYIKTLLFSIGDQANRSPPEWGAGFSGYARRVGSRQGQFVIQNSFVALGNGILGYEPRYNRCQCSGFWRRTGHAVARNFVTYNRTEQALRPQLAMYVGAFGAGAVAGTWKPGNPDLVAEGYRGAITQVGFGIAANWVGEFAPDINRILRRKKTEDNKYTPQP